MHSTKFSSIPRWTFPHYKYWGAPTKSAFSHLEASEDSKERENKKALSVKVKSPDVSMKTNQYTYLFIREKSKDGETYGFYNNSNGEWY